MKIAQISPLMEAVPPKLYGGTERIVAYLCDEMVALGHEVTLFASGDSTTKARLHAAWPKALRLDEGMRDYLAPHMLMLEQLARRSDDFDVVHLHVDYMGFGLLRRLDLPYVTTLHGRLDLPELQPLFRLFDDAPVVSISDSQREPLLDGPGVEFIGEINEHQKTQFLGEAQALLFPVDWPEPFGLSMIEAMACGTPVIAFDRGSVPEVIDDGTTGFVVSGIAEAAAATKRLETLDRARIRDVFEARFTARRMALDYLDLYESIASAIGALGVAEAAE